jgi:dephospho-CoA kinase/inosine/xanthosine triphosphate pyrophosphatase family protein
MRDLIFLTSNITKLAHARYVAEELPVKIKGFRQQTYHANYHEPRLTTRESLLDASYENALEQCIKAGIPTDTTPFFLEDTSVKIDALSSQSTEVPGLDVKYWMQRQSFASLDAELKERHNDRRASVRSDVLLHVPPALSGAWTSQSKYLTFVGVQSGRIVDKEIEYRPNLVFPWLDNQSFNKWFEPDGVEGPFGSLDIARADTVDFRRKSFGELFAFLKAKGYLTFESEQLELQLNNRPNLILCGYTCAGKTTASQHLARKFGYLHIEASDFMHLNYLQRHGYRGPVAIGDFAEYALALKPAIAAEKVAEYIRENLVAPIIVSGFRSPDEIEYLQRKFAPVAKSFEVLFVETAEKTRFERLQARMRPGDNISLEDFRRRDLQQQRMGLEKIRILECAHKLRNDGTFEAYLASLDQQVGAPDSDEIDVRAGLERAARASDMRIEDAILLTLLGVWNPDEARPFFTTTQIAGLIRSTLPGIVPKQKDNVSRYFNQDFYAYYEIDSNLPSRPRRYRLSNTGYGRAVLQLRNIVRWTIPETSTR